MVICLFMVCFAALSVFRAHGWKPHTRTEEDCLFDLTHFCFVMAVYKPLTMLLSDFFCIPSAPHQQQDELSL
jgi:hypothetical protein